MQFEPELQFDWEGIQWKIHSMYHRQVVLLNIALKEISIVGLSELERAYLQQSLTVKSPEIEKTFKWLIVF